MRLHSRSRAISRHRKNASNAQAAALMTIAQIHLSIRMPSELTRLLITLRSFVRRTTITTNGGASSPFNIADQKSIFTALKPAKSKARPTTIASTRLSSTTPRF